MSQTVMIFYQTETRFFSEGHGGTLLKFVLVKSAYIKNCWMLFPFVLKSE